MSGDLLKTWFLRLALGFRQRWVWFPVLVSVVYAVPLIQTVWTAQSRPPTWERDLDSALLHAGLLKAPHLSDTLQWWIGPWVAGPEVPFYRPLSSLLFWSEWKLFPHHDWPYAFPGLAAHMVTLALASVLTCRLAGRWRLPAPELAGALMALLFAGSMEGYRYQVVFAAVAYWKNQPDTFATLFAVAAVLLYLRSQEGRRGDLAGAVACYLTSCFFKESAVLLPLALVPLEWGAGDSAGRRRRLAVLGAAFGLFVVGRSLAIGGVGYTYGSNDGWLNRTMAHLVGPFYLTTASRYPMPNAVGMLLFGAGIAAWRLLRSTSRHRIAGLTGLVITTVAAAGAIGATLGVPPGAPGGWDVGLSLCLDPPTAAGIWATLLFLAAIYVAARHYPRALPFCFGWTAVFLVPLAFSPGPIHRYYLVQIGYALLYALAAALIPLPTRSARSADPLRLEARANGPQA